MTAGNVPAQQCLVCASRVDEFFTKDFRGACGLGEVVATRLLPLLDVVRALHDAAPRRSPDRVFSEHGYDHDLYRQEVRNRGACRGSPVPVIAPELGRNRRWTVEHGVAWLRSFSRLLVQFA